LAEFFQRVTKRKEEKKNVGRRVNVIEEIKSFPKEDDRTTAATKCKRSK
jgi:hypothetical protein